MQTPASTASTAPIEGSRNAILTTLGATVGLALGPSVIANLTITGYITPIEREFGWSRVDVSFAFTIVAYMIVLMSPLQGFLVDRFGPRKVVLTSIPLFALSLAAIYFTPPNLYVYYLLWAIVPVAGIGLWPLGYLQAVTPWFDRKLGLALGCANAGIGVGSTLLPMFVIAPIIAAGAADSGLMMQIVTVGGLFPYAGWRSAVLTLSLMVLFISWPVVAYCLRDLSPAEVAARKEAGAAKSFGLSFQQARREPTFWMLNIGFFLLGVTATSLVTQQAPLLQDAGWTPAETARLQTTFGFGLLFARIAVGYVIDHIFAPRVLTTVSIGGALACILYALYPDVGYVSALLIGFLLGAEFDVLAFLIKRYYGNAAYGRLYGVIFGVFYLGSGIGIWALPKIRELSGNNYDNGLYVAAVILAASAILMSFMPKYRYGVGHATEPVTGTPATQTV
jgi:MFS family permease